MDWMYQKSPIHSRLLLEAFCLLGAADLARCVMMISRVGRPKKGARCGSIEAGVENGLVLFELFPKADARAVD